MAFYTLCYTRESYSRFLRESALIWTNKKSLLIYSNISYLESRTESVNKININISCLPLQTIPVFKQRHYSKSNTCIKHQRIDYDRMN